MSRRRQRYTGKFAEYTRRNKLLAKLGYESYQLYLDSPLWQQIRARVLTKACGRCRLCGSKATQVHHLSYSKNVLLGKTLFPLIALCASCHKRGEFTESGHKTNVAEASQRMGIVELYKQYRGRTPDDEALLSPTKRAKRRRRREKYAKRHNRAGTSSTTSGPCVADGRH